MERPNFKHGTYIESTETDIVKRREELQSILDYLESKGEKISGFLTKSDNSIFYNGFCWGSFASRLQNVHPITFHQLKEMFGDVDVEIQKNPTTSFDFNSDSPFKAVRHDGKDWVHGYLVRKTLHNKFDSPPSLIYVKYFIDSGSDLILFDSIFHQVEVLPSTICRFIGLFDLNGKKVYEGDETVFNEKECHIVYNRDLASFGLFFPLEELWLPLWECENGIINLEFKGNIHDKSINSI